MSSRLLILGETHRPLVRKTRRDDGRAFGVFTIRDSDRLEVRFWTAFVNDADLMQEIERLRIGEPIGVSGPFSMAIVGPVDAPTIDYRVTVAGLVSVAPRKPKTKTLIRKEEAVRSDEAAHAPSAVGQGEELNDELPF